MLKYASCSGGDDSVGLQTALNYATTLGITLDFGSANCSSSTSLTANAASVYIRADRGAGSITFTSGSSCGFSFTPTGGSLLPAQHVLIRGLRIVAAAACMSPAISVAYSVLQSTVDWGVDLENLDIGEDTFGTHRFAKGISLTKFVNAYLQNINLIGDSPTTATDAIYLDYFTVANLQNINVDFFKYPIHVSINSGGTGSETLDQGLQINQLTVYGAASQCMLVDGTPSGATPTLLQGSLTNGSCSTNNAAASGTEGLKLYNTQEFTVSNYTIYNYPGASTDAAIDLDGSAENFIGPGVYLLNAEGSAAGYGIYVHGASSNNTITGSFVNFFSTGLVFNASVDTANFYASNSLNANTVALSDSGTANIDGGNTVTHNTNGRPINTLSSLPNLQSGTINKFRNGALDIWQRGASSLPTGSSAPGSYTADGWEVYQAGAQGTCGQDAGNNGPLYSLKCIGASSNTDTQISQPIESNIAAPLAGQTVTVQVQYKQSSGSAATPKISTCYASTQDNFTTCTSDLSSSNMSNSCASGSWCTEAYTLSVSSSAAKGYRITFDCDVALTSAEGCWIDAADIRVTPNISTGANSSPPIAELRPIGIEMPLNQRYFAVVGAGGVGTVRSSTLAEVAAAFPVTMRAAPSLSWVGGAISFYEPGIGTLSGTAVAGNATAINGLEADITISSGTTNSMLTCPFNFAYASAEL